jgi:hypothetical protein
MKTVFTKKLKADELWGMPATIQFNFIKVNGFERASGINL